MDLNKVDREVLKNVLKEIITEDFDSFRALIKETVREIISENEIAKEESNEVRVNKLESFIDEDFDNYDEVFKALA